MQKITTTMKNCKTNYLRTYTVMSTNPEAALNKTMLPLPVSPWCVCFACQNYTCFTRFICFTHLPCIHYLSIYPSYTFSLSYLPVLRALPVQFTCTTRITCPIPGYMHFIIPIATQTLPVPNTCQINIRFTCSINNCPAATFSFDSCTFDVDAKLIALFCTRQAAQRECNDHALWQTPECSFGSG